MGQHPPIRRLLRPARRTADRQFPVPPPPPSHGCSPKISSTPNQWSAVNSAILLIDGLDVPRDLDTAAALVDPRTRRSRPADDPIRPQSLALYAYLRATHPEIYAKTGQTPDRAQARRDLEKLAETDDLSKWYLARLLAESPDAA
ncbi:MAG: hypothetical protein QM760_00560 [Nibricoccus sp.]